MGIDGFVSSVLPLVDWYGSAVDDFSMYMPMIVLFKMPI